MAAGASGWAAVAQGVTAAAAGTAKSVLKVLPPANRAVKATHISVGFIGALGAAKPVLVELCHGSEAGAGSGSSAVTLIAQDGSDAQTAQATATKGYTGEPTTLTVIDSFRVHPQAGLIYDWPLGREPKSGINKSLIVRVTFETGETTTNIDVSLWFEE